MLTVVLVIIAIPANSRRQHIVALGGVSFGLNGAGEVVFTQVAGGTPSSLAGILPGDTLVAIDGQALEKGLSAAQWLERLNGRVNTSVTLTVRTGSLTRTWPVGTRFPNRVPPNPVLAQGRRPGLGIPPFSIFGGLVVARARGRAIG